MKTMLKIFTLLCIAALQRSVVGAMLSQNLDHDYSLQWEYDETHITFQLTVHTTGWIGLGFSPSHGMAGADILMAGVRYGKEYLYDCSAQKNGPPDVDESQDAELLHYKQEDDTTSVRIRRKLDTSDGEDMAITKGKMNVIWAWGKWDLKGHPQWKNYHFWNRGHKMITLISDVDLDKYEYKGKTDLAKDASVFWYHDLRDIYFLIKAPTHGWVGLGFSPDGTMAGADLMIAGVKDGECYVHDCYATRNWVPHVDASQDVHIEHCTQTDGKTEVVLKRLVSTNDSRDASIQAGEMMVIWAYGKWDIGDEPKITNYHWWNRGVEKIEFVEKAEEEEEEEEGEKEQEEKKEQEEEDARNDTVPSFTYINFLSKEVELKWAFVPEGYITFQLTAPTKGWMGLGISPGGTMASSDLMIVGEADGKPYAVDANAAKNGIPNIDDSQDLEVLESAEMYSSTRVVFRRALDTGDNNDWRIVNKTQYVLWAYGESDPTVPLTFDLYHGSNRGATKLKFIE